MITIIALILACFFGFLLQRAGFCTVRAVEEIWTSKRAYMLASFLKMSLWVFGITAFTNVISNDLFVVPLSWTFSVYGLIGGFVFGIGATVNAGCAFSMLTRFASGNMGMLMSFLGIGLGFYCSNYIPMAAQPIQTDSFKLIDGDAAYLDISVLILFGSWMAFELFKITKSIIKAKDYKRLLVSRYRLSFAALLMGSISAFLYGLIGIWPFTNLFQQEINTIFFSAEKPQIILWLLFLTLLIGIAIAAKQAKKFRWQVKPQARWLSYAIGGWMMGIGASLIPGGNDILILHAAPSLSIHAVPVFFAIIVGVASTFALSQIFGMTIPKLKCDGDICNEDFDPINKN